VTGGRDITSPSLLFRQARVSAFSTRDRYLSKYNCNKYHEIKSLNTLIN
jgi:hypothetical protein